MGLPWVVAIDDDARPGSKAFSDELVVNRACAEGARNGDPFGPAVSIRDDDVLRAPCDGRGGLARNAPKGRFESVGSLRNVEGGVEQRGAE
jgi:hypothetical protein